MKECFKILSPCGILGYGYPEASFNAGLADNPDAIVVDAGSTDAGPHKLGAGVSIVSKYACRRDLLPMVRASLERNIQLIIGSAGGSGAKVHVEWTLEILGEILQEQGLSAKIAIIWADILPKTVISAIDAGGIQPMSPNVPDLTRETIIQTGSIVAQMGVEPIIAALDGGADIIVCGRAYDPAVFAAPGIRSGYDPALCYHLGKILECGALCADPPTAKDCIMGVLYKDSFEVYPTNPSRTCNPVSVAAHTFYEKDHPYLLYGPGIQLNLKDCEFIDCGVGKVRVQGSKLAKTTDYLIKLEGARRVGFRSFVIAGIRDPIMISHLEDIQQSVVHTVEEYFSGAEGYKISFYNYGLNGVLGQAEPNLNNPDAIPYEICLMMEVISKNSQQEAADICAFLRSTMLHYGFDGRKATAGNLAFPFAPSDINFGPVYEFSVYHTMKVESGHANFTTEWREIHG